MPYTETYSFDVVEISGQDALPTLELLKIEGSQNGFFPVLLGAPDEASWLLDHDTGVTNRRPPEETIAASSRIALPVWFTKKNQADAESSSDEDLIGEWPSKNAGSDGLSGHLDLLSRRPKAKVLIAKIRATNSWEIPAYLGVGNWNSPEENVAIAKYWFEKHGATIVTVTGDTLEFVVTKPPTNREEAMTLAWEQFAYCNDIVTQGVGTVSDLAATLLNSSTWYFWWD